MSADARNPRSARFTEVGAAAAWLMLSESEPPTTDRWGIRTTFVHDTAYTREVLGLHGRHWVAS